MQLMAGFNAEFGALFSHRQRAEAYQSGWVSDFQAESFVCSVTRRGKYEKTQQERVRKTDYQPANSGMGGAMFTYVGRKTGQLPEVRHESRRRVV